MNPNALTNRFTDTSWVTPLVDKGTQIAIQIVGALLLWFVGRWLISMVVNLTEKAMKRQAMDPTLIRYMVSTVVGVLNVILVISILGTFGVQTTTFAALFAAIGLAIGTAWSGLLSNMAAGVFMIILRPFKVGDFICAGGVTGTVHEIGPFATTIDTPDNVRTMVGNSKVLGDNIQNYTINPHRRVERTMQLNGIVPVREIVALLKTKLAEIPNVTQNPPPDVEIIDLNAAGPVLAVRPHTHNDHYWQVYFDTNALIQQIADQYGIAHGMTHVTLHNDAPIAASPVNHMVTVPAP